MSRSEIKHRNSNQFTRVIDETKELRNIHSIRRKNNKIVKVLTDPWSVYSAIWELNVHEGKLIKIVDFEKYHGKEYTEEIKW